MSDTLAELAAKTGIAKPATDKQIASFVKAIGFPPPADYLDYLRLTNGNEKTSGSVFPYTFHSLKNALAHTKDYQFAESGPLVIIGTDGGGNAFCLDGRYQPPRIISTEYGDCGSTENSIDFGTSFAAFLHTLLHTPEGKHWPSGLPPFSSADGIVRKFRAETDWSRQTDPVHYPECVEQLGVNPIGFSPDGAVLVAWFLPKQTITEGQPRIVELGFFQYPSGKFLHSVPYPGCIDGLAPFNAEFHILTNTPIVIKKTWTLINLAKRQLGPTFQCPQWANFGLASLASGKVVACSSVIPNAPSDGPFDVRLTDIETGAEIRLVRVAGLCFTLHRGMLVQNNGRDSVISAQDLDSGKTLWETPLPPMSNPAYHYLFSPDDQTLLVHEGEGKIYGLRASDGKKLFRSKLANDTYFFWAWMPDSRRWLATRNNGRQLSLFDAATGELLVKCPHTPERPQLFPHPNNRDILFTYGVPYVWTLPPSPPLP